MDPIVGEYLATKAANTKTAIQIKLFKGAIEQQGEVALKLIEGAVDPSSRNGFPTGQGLNVSA